MNITKLSILFCTYFSIINGAALYTNNGTNYIIRKTTIEDSTSLLLLYKKVAFTGGFLVRIEDEITPDYIDKITYQGVNNGLALVVEYNGKIIGSMIKYKLEPKIFSHVLTEGSILVDPDFQRQGIGSNLISTFLKEVENNHTTILRVEIITRESNPAINLYEKLGFKKEGRFEKRIGNTTKDFEADIPMVWFNPNFKT